MWSVFLLSACSNPTPPPAPVSDATEVAPLPAPAPVPYAAPTREKVNNAPQIMSVSFVNRTPTAAQNIQAVVKTVDAENDRIDLDFEWFVNDVPVIGVASDRLSARYKKGDKVRAVVTADDGDNEAKADSPIVTIANTTPEVLTDPERVNKVDGFRFEASDADEDELKWRLEGAPSGMSISGDGVLSYKGSETEPGGRYTVAVIVDDGSAWGRMDFPITVSPGSQVKKK